MLSFAACEKPSATFNASLEGDGEWVASRVKGAEQEVDTASGRVSACVCTVSGEVESVAFPNVTVFADGEVDRSPCDSGTSARVALLVEEGRLGWGRTLVHESILGERFASRVVRQDFWGGPRQVVPEKGEMDSRTDKHHFFLDARDFLGPGFVVRYVAAQSSGR